MTRSSTEHPAEACAGADLPASQTMLESISASEHPKCLMCGAANPFGMKLRFRVQRDGAVLALVPCREVFQGYPKILHGGVISAMLDAAMTNALFSIGVIAVTAELTVRFLKPVSINHGAVIRASIAKESFPPLYHVHSELSQDRKLTARADAKFMAIE